ncbi:MAG TPA: glycine--tRNA ligase [Candidatus Bilamarchaeaceae archaeon]|nr:glycine--tRNA ligase [Candidatus Bilamarchaeaceae archaeon]
MKLYEKIFDVALQRSIFFPSNEVYNPVSGFYDYGPVGILIKNKIQNLWRKLFIKNEGFHEVETTIVTPELVLKASGHVDSFADPIVECKKCKVKARADHLVEEVQNNYKFEGNFDELNELLKKHKITCPSCKKGELSEATSFNLMFKTGVGGEREVGYNRPETAQGIFTAFFRLYRNHGAKLPLAVAQIGKSFRNEISPRKGLVRMREFTQMELEYFFNPDFQDIEGSENLTAVNMIFEVDGKKIKKTTKHATDEKISANGIMSYFLAKEWVFYRMCGIPEEKMYFRVLGKGELPHYSKGNIDMEVETSYGNVETIGNAYRTDYDISQHSKFSKKDLSVFDPANNKKLVPHVFEASLGVDRLFFCILEHCYRERNKDKPGTSFQIDGTGNSIKEWDWFDFPPLIAPYEVAVFPLMKKDGLQEIAQELVKKLKENFDVLYSETGAIGKRYARSDEIGCPFAITIDYQTKEDHTVTIRYRNDSKQERIKIDEVISKVKENIESNRVVL